MFWKSGQQWWNINSIIYVPDEEEIKAFKVRETRWPSDGAMGTSFVYQKKKKSNGVTSGE
jgi:hypothetical protein